MPLAIHDLPCLYFAFTGDGQVTDVSNTLCTTLGYEAHELIGQKADNFFTISTRIFNQTHLLPLLKMQGYVNEIFITLKAKNNNVVPLLINATTQQQLPNNIIVSGILVENRKKYEDELIAAKQAAENALKDNSALQQLQQQLQHRIEQLDTQIHKVEMQNFELRQFNRVVTHDMQEPLRKLSMFSNMLQVQGHGDPIAITRKIQRVADQMRATVSGLQQYIWLSEVQSKFEPCDLAAIMLAANEKLASEHNEQLLHLQLPLIPLVPADAEQMQILFYELFSNAIRYRRPDHKATVHVQAQTLQRNKFRAVEGKYSYTEFLRLYLRDDGLGFDPAYKNQLFELFKKLNYNNGQGVGLALCKKIVTNHHGDIAIDSQPNEGATITILLPLTKQQERYETQSANVNTNHNERS